MSLSTRPKNTSIHRGQPVNILPGKFLWVLLASLSVFLMASVLAAPIIGFFLNHEQKQCHIGIGGDENSDFIPRYPWQKAEPNSNGMIQTQFGSCNFHEIYRTISPEDCCRQLGYTYVAGDIPGDWIDLRPNQPTPEPQSRTDTFSNFVILLIVALAIFLVIKLIKNISNKHKTTGE